MQVKKGLLNLKKIIYEQQQNINQLVEISEEDAIKYGFINDSGNQSGNNDEPENPDTPITPEEPDEPIVAPDVIEVYGIIYYKVQPNKPGENYELISYYSNEYNTTYYTWKEIEQVIPNETEEQEDPNRDYSKEYLTFEVIEGNCEFSIENENMQYANFQYSLDNGENWISLNKNEYTPIISKGKKILWKQYGLNPKLEIGHFINKNSGKFKVYGNIMSLLYGDNFENKSDSIILTNLFTGCTTLINAKNLILPTTTLASNCYNSMFKGCKALTTAPELPANTLVNYCYRNMFSGCTSLTTAPALSATTLADNCYSGMFSGCTSLTTAPELPATTLNDYCYEGMFSGCTSLTIAPELPATTLASYCYWNMFSGCTSLTTAPELPATTMTNCCYSGMFSGCTSLTTAPELPATTLAIWCYQYMFNGCYALTEGPELPATTLAESCYSYMFSNCTSLTTAPELPATTLADYSYSGMFKGCTSLNYIKCLNEWGNGSGRMSCDTWLEGVGPKYIDDHRVFVKKRGVEWPIGSSGIPEGWEVIEVDE